jgi:hypothetical protein
MTTKYEKISKTGRVIGKFFERKFPDDINKLKIIKLGDGTFILCLDGAVQPLAYGNVAVTEGKRPDFDITSRRVELTELNVPYKIGVVNPAKIDARKVADVRAVQLEPRDEAVKPFF